MPDDSLPPADKAVVAFFEIVAFALGWEGVARLLDGKSWLSVLPIFAATILTSYTGFKWPQIKLKVGNRLGLTGQYRSMLAVVALLLLTAYDFYDRHVNGALALVPWWHYGPILLGVAAVIWLMIGGLPRNKPSKLVIHRAVYAAGLQSEVSVTDKLKNAGRDALVITVDNTLGNLLPHDPAFNVRKRLDVDYSYGSDTVFHVSRMEPPVGEISRLLLPEDSEVQRLTDELAIAKQQHEVEEFKFRQIRDMALADARTAKERIAELEARLAKAVASRPGPLDNSLQGTVTSDPWLSLLHSRQELEEELRPLLEIEESGVKLVPQLKVGKDESDYRREKIARLRRDIEDIGKRLVSTKHKGPDIMGEILHVRRPMRISPYRGHERSMLLLKVRVSTRTESAATIRRANLIVESDGKKYEGQKQPIEIDPEPVIFHHQFGQSQEEKPFDLVDRVAKEPLRCAVGTEGWLQFLVDGLPDGVGIADLYLTITDDLGGEHLISAKSFSID